MPAPAMVVADWSLEAKRMPATPVRKPMEPKTMNGLISDADARSSAASVFAATA